MGDLYNALGTAVSSSEEEMRGLTNSLQEGTLTGASVSAALQNVEANGTNVLASMERLEAQFEDVADNPVLYLRSIVAVAVSEGLETAKSHVIAAPLAKSLLVKHFGDTRAQASAELGRLGVVDGLDGMKFGMSTIFTREHPDEIHLVVYYKLKVVQFFQWADFKATICKETRARAWLGGDDVQALAKTAAVSDGGSSGESSGDSTITEEDDEEGTQEEEESDSPIEDIRAQMIEQYGAEVVGAVSQGQDISTWSKEDWNNAINLYLLYSTCRAPEPTASPEPTPRPFRDIMIENFGQATVDAVSDGADTSSWTEEDWQFYITVYLENGSTWRDWEFATPTPKPSSTPELSAIEEDIKITEPTLPEGGKPKGNYEPSRPGYDGIPIKRQNDSADILAEYGYDIEMLPEKIGGNGYGVKESSNPVYLIDGEAFDCYAPDGSKARNVWSNVKEKTEKQAERIILNLDDYKGSEEELYEQFKEWQIDTLKELIVIKNGTITRWLPE